MSALSRLTWVVISAMFVFACDKQPTPEAPGPAQPAVEAPEPLASPSPAAPPTPATPAPPAPAAPAAPSSPPPPADAPTPPADVPTPPPADTPTAVPPPITLTPGTIVRDTVPDSPEWLIQQVLLASMDPNEETGWARFLSLLHEDQKTQKALISRRGLNFPASRRKVKLFLFEDPTKPYYKIDRILEEAPGQVRIFVHNNSPDSMPTPCELRFEHALKKWRIGICSL